MFGIMKSPFFFIKTLLEKVDRETVKIRPKAIRDKIPELRGTGEGISQKTDEQFLEYMEIKVLEEFAEYLENRSIKEFADLLDVLDRIRALNHWYHNDIEKIRNDKAQRKGTFMNNLVLESK